MSTQGKGFKPASLAAKNSKLAQPNAELEARGLAAGLRSERKSKSNRQIEAQAVNINRMERCEARAKKLVQSDNFKTAAIVNLFVDWWDVRSDQGQCAPLKRSGAVLVALAGFVRADALCWPSQSKIAARSGCKPRTVRTALKKLEALGLIEVTPDGAKGQLRGRTNLYWFNVEYMLDLMRAEVE